MQYFLQVPGGDLSKIGGDGGYTWRDMIPFWRAYHPWLAARGFHLFEPIPDDYVSGYIFPPPTKCPAAPPYAIYADVELDEFQLTPFVSELDVRD